MILNNNILVLLTLINNYMNKFVYILLLLILAQSLFAQNYYNNPESAVYDSLRKRYLISNVGSGNIVQIDSNQITTNFNTQLTRTLGMVIVNDTLYVNDITGVVVFSLNNDTLITTIPIDCMDVLNDITADTSGYLYITDSGNGNIYRVKISSHVDSIIASGIYWPNGILYDRINNRILFCAFGNSVPIRSINLTNFYVSTVVTTNFSDLDGLTFDNLGRLYVSSWGNNSVYRYDQNFISPPELVSSGFNGPADIYYDNINEILVVPNFNSNTVDFIPIDPSFIKENQQMIPQQIKLYQNSPNPFNPYTTIKFAVPHSSYIKMNIYNLMGQKIKTLYNKKIPAGLHSIEWDGRDDNGHQVSSGLYIYKLNTIKFSKAMNMIFIK